MSLLKLHFTTLFQHYSLRWNNHQSHVLSAFDALLQNESLVDCTLVCEDTNVKAHRVVLSACSPYFQKIFMDNPCKHPIIVLKDVRGWEAQCIVDFMYKGETSVPESQLTELIKAAEGLRVRGLTSSDHSGIPRGLSLETTTTPSPSSPNHNNHSNGYNFDQGKHHHQQSSPISLTAHDSNVNSTTSSVNAGSSGPRRKQARPRRRSGDSVGGSSMDLSSSKADSPPNRKSPETTTTEAVPMPENLSLKRPRSSDPAINLVSVQYTSSSV